jgi:hypothetical protein
VDKLTVSDIRPERLASLLPLFAARDAWRAAEREDVRAQCEHFPSQTVKCVAPDCPPGADTLCTNHAPGSSAEREEESDALRSHIKNLEEQYVESENMSHRIDRENAKYRFRLSELTRRIHDEIDGLAESNDEYDKGAVFAYKHVTRLMGQPPATPDLLVAVPVPQEAALEWMITAVKVRVHPDNHTLVRSRQEHEWKDEVLNYLRAVKDRPQRARVVKGTDQEVATHLPDGSLMTIGQRWVKDYPTPLLVLLKKWVHARAYKGHIDPYRLLDKLDTLHPQRVRVVEGVADNGIHVQLKGVGPYDIAPGTPVKVLIEEGSDE